MLRVFDDEVRQCQSGFDGRFALRVVTRAAIATQGNGDEFVRHEGRLEKRAECILVEVHRIEVELAGAFREIVLAGDVEAAARIEALSHSQRNAPELRRLVLHAKVEVERRLVILELIIAVTSREIAQHQVARRAGFPALAQGKRRQFDRAGRSVELRTGREASSVVCALRSPLLNA